MITTTAAPTRLHRTDLTGTRAHTIAGPADHRVRYDTRVVEDGTCGG
jgi:hypothetical protein